MTANEEERYDVFLGGSCGGRKSPTSWRKKVAIPLLLKNRVKFFNPQVDTWTIDLVHKENSAKDKSNWLLFVLEMTTRGIASMVEIAYLVGLGRSVVFVLQKDRKHGKIKIPDDSVSSEELVDIMWSQHLLAEMLALHEACRCCSALKSGLEHVIRSLKQSTVCTNAGSCEDFRKAAVSVRSYVSKAAAGVFKNFFTGWAGEDKRGQPRRKRHRKSKTTAAAAVSQASATAAIARAEHGCRLLAPIILATPAASQKVVGVIGSIPPTMQEQLRTRGLRILPDPCANSGTKKLLPADCNAQLLACCALLVFIPSDSLACSVMCKAAYYIGQHTNTVLCVQDIPERGAPAIQNSVVSLTAGAVRDYNRGRAYLRDFGQRQGSFVCEDLDKAIEEVCARTLGTFSART